jgi:hypothetical protein
MNRQKWAMAPALCLSVVVDVADPARVALQIEHRDRSEPVRNVGLTDQLGRRQAAPHGAAVPSPPGRSGQDPEPAQRGIERLLAFGAGRDPEQVMLGDGTEKTVPSHE